MKYKFFLISSKSKFDRISFSNFTIIFTIIILTSFLFVYPCGDITQLIGNPDEANLADLARNIAIGKGAVVNNVWLLTNGGMEGDSLPQPEPYFSLYPAYIIAIFFKLFGFSRNVFILPALLMRAIIIGLCLFLVREQTKSWPACFLITFILTLSNTLNNYVNGLSDIYLACFMSLSTFFLSLACARKKSSLALFVASGIFGGASVGIKISGIFSFSVLLILIIRLFNSNNLKQSLRQIFLYLIGGTTGLSAFVVYNLKNFGSILPGGYELASEAARIRHALKYLDNEAKDSFSNAFFNPDISLKNIDNPPSFLIYLKDNFREFIGNIFDGQILQAWWLIFALSGIYIVVRRAKNNGFQILNINEWFVLFSIPILVCGIALGSLINYQPRYWLFCAPYILISSIYGIHNLVRKQNIIYIFMAILSLPWVIFGTTNLMTRRPIPNDVIYNKRCIPASNAYEKIINLIPKDSIVMTHNPWQFSFHTGFRSVKFPDTDNVKTVVKIANKYKASFIAVIENDEKIKLLQQKFNFNENKFFDLFYDKDNLQIYKILLNKD